ncbi:MAG TPA: calcium/sodium antiporter [Candidatus Nitrosocosmicus sp.]|nr:calcium/sodium antiporter [Candidatus Nitrosocosmicus sp.]
MILILLYILGLGLIFYLLAKICDQYFVKSLDIISKKLKLSPDIAGATFMAIGTSAPEFFTAVIALTKVGSENIGAGTIVGSAIFNILVIVGASAVVSTAFLKWKPVIRDMGFYLISIIVLLVTFIDGVITLPEAIMYLVFYGIYIVILAHWRKIVPGVEQMDKAEEVVEELKREDVILSKKKGIWSKFVLLVDTILAKLFPDLEKKPQLYWLTFAISILLIIGLSWSLVEIAILFAHTVGIPEVIIALTILAGGTSVPDLLASIIVAKKKRGDMAVSNAVGSNTFDILICLGLPWLVYILFTGKSIAVATDNLISSILLLFFTVIAILFVLIVQKFKLGRKSGYVLIGIYICYLIFAIIKNYK